MNSIKFARILPELSIVGNHKCNNSQLAKNLSRKLETFLCRFNFFLVIFYKKKDSVEVVWEESFVRPNIRSPILNVEPLIKPHSPQLEFISLRTSYEIAFLSQHFLRLMWKELFNERISNIDHEKFCEHLGRLPKNSL